MRLLALAASLAATCALAAGAAAGTPRFAVYDLRLDLAHASHNPFGDIKVWRRRDALARRAPGATLVRCGTGCPFGAGWFAFSRPARLSSRDLGGAAATRLGRAGWGLSLRLTAAGRTRWTALERLLAQRQRTRGVPDVLAVVVGGTVVAAPLSPEVKRSGDTLTVPGLTKARALAAAKTLQRR